MGFEFIFGNGCPASKEFGTGIFQQLMAADGIADAFDFKWSPIIRGPEFKQQGGFTCIHGHVFGPGCPDAKEFLCARETIGAGPQCLNAMWQLENATSAEKGQACATAEG